MIYFADVLHVSGTPWHLAHHLCFGDFKSSFYQNTGSNKPVFELLCQIFLFVLHSPRQNLFFVFHSRQVLFSFIVQKTIHLQYKAQSESFPFIYFFSIVQKLPKIDWTSCLLLEWQAFMFSMGTFQTNTTTFSEKK